MNNIGHRITHNGRKYRVDRHGVVYVEEIGQSPFSNKKIKVPSSGVFSQLNEQMLQQK